MVPPVLSLALSLLLGSVLAHQPARAATAECPQLFAGGQAPTLSNPRMELRTTPLCNLGYAVLASGITRGPLWSTEHLTAASIAEARHMRREGQFHPDDRLPEDGRSGISDYVRGGFDRGHMSPSGDFPDERQQAQSFALSNVVPQTAALNRGVWEGIENAVRDLAQRDGDFYAVTGPAFQGAELRSIGAGVLVPSSTRKAVYDPRANGTGVYVCKNTRTPTCDTVSVSVLVQATGIDPFPALPDGIKRDAMALPAPEDSPYADHHRSRHSRQARSLLEELLE